jgi:hypothetical protein
MNISMQFEADYPNITRWVKDCGTVVIGYDPNRDSFVRAIDEGGMIWSGKSRYETIDDAVHDLEVGLGQILVGLALGAEPSAKRKSTPRPPRPKKTPDKRRKASIEESVPKQVIKLEEIVAAIRGKEIVQVTRLTVVKKLCENPEATGAFAMFLAQKAQERLHEKQGNERYRELAARAGSEMKAHMDDPTEVHKQRLRSLLLEIEVEQNEYVSVQWSAVRNIKSWDLLIVENTLRSILNRDAAPRWLYQAARDYVGGSIEFEKKSIPQLEEIAQFWRRYFTVKM